MNIYIQGNANPITLGTKEFLAQGGEGSVYAKSGMAYKIYNDPSKMIPVGKIKELSMLSKENILNPQNVLLDSKNNAIGYCMKYVPNTIALCQLFTKAFRDRNKIDNDKIIDLVKDMQSTVQHIHNNKMLIVDLNELNFLTDDKFDKVYFIDVDSYQTEKYPATAIMESIRDRHCNNNWSYLTDWFSFGIVTFQMFIGIHPYKGKHSTLNGFEERMKANVSVLNNSVTIPKVCYPLSVIPQSYLDWYKAIFEHGKRLMPPTDLIPNLIIGPVIKKINGTNNFEIKEISSLNSDILDLFTINGNFVAITKNDIFINDKPSNHLTLGKTLISLTPRKNDIISCSLNKQSLELFNLSKNIKIQSDISFDSISIYNNRLYGKSGSELIEIEWIETNQTVIPSYKNIANIHDNSKLFNGVAVQNLLGTFWVTIFPESRVSYTIQIPEIQGQVLDAKFDNNVLMVITSQTKNKNIQYNKYVIRFDKTFNNYDIKTRTNTDLPVINFITLDNGICCSFNEEEQIVLFKNKKDDTLVKIIDDDEIKGHIQLYKNNNNVMFTLKDTLYTLKMK